MLKKWAERCKLSFRFILVLKGVNIIVDGVIFVGIDWGNARFKAKYWLYGRAVF